MSGAEQPHKPRPLRLAFLVPAFDIGGAERVALRFAGRLDRGRYQTTLAAFVRGTGRLLEEARAAGVGTAVVGQESDSRLRLLLRLVAWLREVRPDVLFTLMFHGNIAGRIAGKISGIPIVISSERVVGWESRTRILANRFTLRLATAVTTNSRAGRVFWSERLGVDPRSITVLYNGVDTEQFRPTLESDRRVPRMGVLARLHRKNGHAWFLRCLSALKGLGDSWECVLAGEGDEQALLERMIGDLKLDRRVAIVQHTSDPVGFLRTLDVYVQPSLAEGMPNAVLEAMACGLPVVATDVGGTREAVVDGETGWLVRPGDCETIVARLRVLLSDQVLRRRMGDAARLRVERNFSLDSAVQALDRLITELAAEHLSSGPHE